MLPDAVGSTRAIHSPPGSSSSWAERYRLLYDVIGDIVLFISPDGRVLEANRAACNAYGYTRDELVQLGISDLRAPETLEVLALQLAEANSAGSLRFDTRHRRRDATTFPVEVNSTAADVDGARVFVSVVRDMTERVRAAEALRGSEERFRVVFGIAGIGLAEIDPLTRRFVRANPTFCDITGYTAAELYELTARDLTHPDDRSDDDARYEEYLGGAAGFSTDKRYVRKDGRTVWVHVTGNMVRDAVGRPLRSIAVIQDVTEQRRTDAALREREERFRLMADQTPIMVWVTGTTGRAEFVNREYCRFFGITPAQAIGEGWQVLVHPEDGGYAAAFFDALATRSVFEARARVRRHDGEWRTIVSCGTPRYASNGEFLGVIGTSRDVTDEDRLVQAEREAARQKDEFIAVLAHELRNPLAPIRTAMALFQARGSSDPALARARGVVERQVAHMARLLDDLLDVSRLSRGKLSLQRTAVRLRDVVDAAVEIARPVIDQQQHALELQGLQAPVVLDADGARLTQVLGNLLTNAARYTPPGGRITVRSARESSGVVAISVEDTGIGIPTEMLGRVFELFTQIHHPERRPSTGLGIGLALSRRLVEMHGGTLTVLSDGAGRGSTFTVRLPIAGPGVAAVHEVARPLSSAPWVRRRVLVADDNVDAADTLALLLGEAGCDVETVYSGRDALAAAERNPPHVMVLDLGMPGIDGHAVARHVRSQPWGTQLTLIAVTGWGHDDDRRRSLLAGFDAHLVKPVSSELLVDAIRTASSPRI